MTIRDQITVSSLAQSPKPVPVAVIGSQAGYAVAVGDASSPRWLHSTSGRFKLFPTLDRAAAVLRQCGIHQFRIDTTGGNPR